MKDQYPDTCRISIYANDSNRVMSRILQLFSKSRFAVNYIQIFKTQDENLTLIIIDVSFPKETMRVILNQIEKIMEVHSAFVNTSESGKQFLGLYTVPPDFYKNPLCDTLKNKGVQISATAGDLMVLQFVGAEEEIEQVRRLLANQCSTGFYKSMWPDMTGFPAISTEQYNDTVC